MLTIGEAKELVAVVAGDVEAARRIDSNIDAIVPASWGLAGGIRNAGYVALGMVSLGTLGDPTHPEYANRVCTGISDAASPALNRAVAKKDPRVRRLRASVAISRLLNGVDHTAVQIDLDDGQKHVIDWHATLIVTNPMLFDSPARWARGEGGVVLKDFAGWK